MALTRIQSVFTYQSSSGGQAYTFDIVIDQQGLVGVRNIRTPLGLITDSLSQVPEAVAQDMLDALDLVRLSTDESSVAGGTVSFTGQTSLAVVIAAGLLNNAKYRVYLTSPDGVVLKAANKTISGFDIESASTYGSQTDPKVVCWEVFVSTSQASTFGGTLTFLAGSVSQVVTFPAAIPTANYRVLLGPSDFFLAKVTSRTKAGFTVELGHDPAPGSVTVGYDVLT